MPTTMNPHTLVAVVSVARSRLSQVTHHVPQAQMLELDEHVLVFDGIKLNYMDGEQMKSLQPGEQAELGEFTIRFDVIKQAKDIDGWTKQVHLLKTDGTKVRLDDKFDGESPDDEIIVYPPSDQDWPASGLTVPELDEEPLGGYFIGHAVC